MFASPASRLGLVAGVLVIFAGIGAALIFAPGSRPTAHTFELQVVGTQMSPDQLQAGYNDPVTISIVADKAEEIHLHGYDKHFFTKPGQAVTLTFPADKTGQFVMEIESSSIPLGTLVVKPGSGFLGFGQPQDQSNTTVVKSTVPHVTQVGSTDSYNLSLQVGGLEPMYMPADVAKTHPKSGEIMFSGQMQMPPGMEGMGSMTGMAYPPGWRHLEVHIFDKKTGNVVKTVMPQITVTNAATGQSQTVPVVTMQGLADGVGDFHYGNNVLMPNGQYTVSVVINGESASFNLTAS